MKFCFINIIIIIKDSFACKVLKFFFKYLVIKCFTFLKHVYITNRDQSLLLFFKYQNMKNNFLIARKFDKIIEKNVKTLKKILRKLK